MPLSSGDKLGPYEIVSPLGAGGMGDNRTCLSFAKYSNDPGGGSDLATGSAVSVVTPTPTPTPTPARVPAGVALGDSRVTACILSSNQRRNYTESTTRAYLRVIEDLARY